MRKKKVKDALVYPDLSSLDVPFRRRDLSILELRCEELVEVDPEGCGFVVVADSEVAYDGVCARSCVGFATMPDIVSSDILLEEIHRDERYEPPCVHPGRLLARHSGIQPSFLYPSM